MENHINQKRNKNEIPIKKLLIAVSIILLISAIFFLLVIWIASDLRFAFPPSMNLQSINNFAGAFNILTSIFTALAFAGVIISIHLQSAELKTAISAFEGQESSLKNQEIDNKFFKMLNFFSEVRRNFKVNINGNEYLGGNAFNKLTEELLNAVSESYAEDRDQDVSKLFKEEFLQFNNKHDPVKYYFLNLYQILNYIKNQSVNVDSLKMYTNMLRAQLSKGELVLLAYNAIGVQAFTNNNYQNLVEEYAFFEHLTPDDFFDDNAEKLKIIANILISYQDKAFGANQDLVAQIKEIYKSRNS